MQKAYVFPPVGSSCTPHSGTSSKTRKCHQQHGPVLHLVCGSYKPARRHCVQKRTDHRRITRVRLRCERPAQWASVPVVANLSQWPTEPLAHSIVFLFALPSSLVLRGLSSPRFPVLNVFCFPLSGTGSARTTSPRGRFCGSRRH